MFPTKHISPSSVNTFFNCGEQWRRRYVEGEKRPPGIAAHIGSGVHGAAEYNHKQKIETRRDEPLTTLQDKARDSFLHRFEEGVHIAPDEKKGQDQLKAEGIDSATKLTEVYRLKCAPNIWPEYVEQFVYMDILSLPVPILGILDLATEDGCVLDLKTSGRKWSQSKADSNMAMAVYPALYQHLTGKTPKNIGFEIFVNNKTPQYQQLSVYKNNEDFELFVKRAGFVIEMVELGMFPPAQPGAWNCSLKWCGYWWDCPHVPQRLKNSNGF